MSKPRFRYSAADLAFIEERRDWPRRELAAALSERLNRHVLPVSVFQVCARNGWVDPQRRLFQAGHRAPHTLPSGSERVWTEGFVMLRLDEPSRRSARYRWVKKHRWLWEREHGPIPAGMILVCLGDRSNCDPSNWKLVSRGASVRLARRGLRKAPIGLKPTIVAVAELEDLLKRKGGG